MRAAAGAFLALLLLLLACGGAGAQSAPAPSAGAQGGATAAGREAQALIGLGLEEIFARFGAPSEVLSLRGAAEEQDDVVFYYSAQHLYLFWFQNRVWQVRYDRRHAGAPFSLSMGVSRQRVIELLGRPQWELVEPSGGSALVYQLEDRGYPVRLRLYFEDERLVDLYCYRSDL